MDVSKAVAGAEIMGKGANTNNFGSATLNYKNTCKITYRSGDKH